VLADWQTAPIEPRLRATLALLSKVTLVPQEVVASDVAAVRAEGVSEQAINDALHVCFSFNLIDRLADAFDWHVQSGPEFEKDARFLLKKGYELVGPVRRRALAGR
jgi:alkylhydroperoxidase family enzyme